MHGKWPHDLGKRAGDRIYTTLTPTHDPSGPASTIALEGVGNNVLWNPTIAIRASAVAVSRRSSSGFARGPTGRAIYTFAQKDDHRIFGRPNQQWSGNQGQPTQSVLITGDIAKRADVRRRALPHQAERHRHQRLPGDHPTCGRQRHGGHHHAFGQSERCDLVRDQLGHAHRSGAGAVESPGSVPHVLRRQRVRNGDLQRGGLDLQRRRRSAKDADSDVCAHAGAGAVLPRPATLAGGAHADPASDDRGQRHHERESPGVGPCNGAGADGHLDGSGRGAVQGQRVRRTDDRPLFGPFLCGEHRRSDLRHGLLPRPAVEPTDESRCLCLDCGRQCPGDPAQHALARHELRRKFLRTGQRPLPRRDLYLQRELPADLDEHPAVFTDGLPASSTASCRSPRRASSFRRYRVYFRRRR